MSVGTARGLSVGITVWIAAALVTTGALSSANHDSFGNVTGAAFALACVAVGLALAWHVPRNPIGWLTLAVPGFLSGVLLCSEIATAVHKTHPGLASALVVAVQFLYFCFIFDAPLVLLVFPDGGLPSPRWRGVLNAYLVVASGVLLAILGWGVSAVAGHQDLDAPAGGAGPPATVQLVLTVLLIGCLALALSWVIRRIVGYRTTTGVVRQQFKWLALGAVCVVISLLASFVTPSGNSTEATVLNLVTGIAGLPFPVTIGLAVLRYRLYDIDRVVSRTLSYALLTAILVGVYIGLVVLSTHILGFSSPVAVAAATLIAAFLFAPVRRRLQHRVDRRFNRVRYDADATVDAFAGRLREAMGVEAVFADFTATVVGAVEPSIVAVWLPTVTLPERSGNRISP